MNLRLFLNDERFNIFFSFVLGIGIICILRPICEGSACNTYKAPSEKDFDNYVYQMTEGKCIEFKPEIVSCPVSGTIEAFKECSKSSNLEESFSTHFSKRQTPIKRCN